MEKTRISSIQTERQPRRKRAVSMTSFLLALVMVICPMPRARSSALSCNLEEHTHTDDCYSLVLTCGEAESEEHAHGDSCYEQVLTCSKPEHVHSSSCYPPEPVETSEPSSDPKPEPADVPPQSEPSEPTVDQPSTEEPTEPSEPSPNEEQPSSEAPGDDVADPAAEPQSTDEAGTTPSPDASLTPEPSVTPEASQEPDVSASPEASATPEVSPSPDASTTPDPSATPEASPVPSPTPSPMPEPGTTPMPGEDDDAIEQDDAEPDFLSPLKIQMSVKPKFAQVGQEVVWQFSIESEREPHLNWYLYRNGALLKSGMFLEGERQFAFIPNQAGSYAFKLVAKADVGEGEAAHSIKLAKTVKLTVISAPTTPVKDFISPISPTEISEIPLNVELFLDENKVVIGEEAVYHYAVSGGEKTEIVWQLYKNGYELENGVFEQNAGSYVFIPDDLGVYAFRLTAMTEQKTSEESNETVIKEQSKVAKLMVTEPPELTVSACAHASYCFGGDSVTFGLTRSDNRYAEAAKTRIVVRQGGSVIYDSTEFSESVRVRPAVLDDACTLRLTVELEDQFGQQAEAAVEIPCPMHETEGRYLWSQLTKDVKLTGNWPQDILAVAQSQLGYKESQKDFIIRDDGERQGWSRYGAWYGMPYEEWCSMFVSFCLEYAKVPEWAVPQSASQQRLRNRLIEKGLYLVREDAQPRPGDLIFFDHETEPWEKGYGTTDHIGIVLDVDDERVYTIEGNSNIRVREREYLLTDPHIAGYGLVNEVYEINHPEQEEEAAGDDNEDNSPVEAEVSQNGEEPETAALPSKGAKQRKLIPLIDDENGAASYDKIRRAL